MQVFSDGAASNFKQQYTLSYITLFLKYFESKLNGSSLNLTTEKGGRCHWRTGKRMVWMGVKSGTTIQNIRQLLMLWAIKINMLLLRRYLKIQPSSCNSSTHTILYVQVLDEYVVQDAHLLSEQSVRMIHRFYNCEYWKGAACSVTWYP